MKILSPRVHGFVDYAVVLLLALAPTLFGFDGTPRTICYALAAIQGGMSLLTAYPLGIVKAIPFTIHGSLEALTAPMLAVMPWLFGFADVASARNFFLASAGALALTWALTNYKAARYESYHHASGRRSHA